MISAKVRAALLALSLASAAGCVAYVRPPRVGVVYAMREPPPARVEVISVAPSAAHVWIAGHWMWRGSDYEWIGGRWEQPAAGFRRWEPGRWQHDRNGWFWEEGHWR